MPDADTFCPKIAAYYRNVVKAIESMGRVYGFEAVFFWQPQLANTRKPRTAWERSPDSMRGWTSMARRCTAAADSVMADRLGSSYFPLNGMFDSDTSTVFLDNFSHVTEAANARIADAISETVEPLLERER